MTYFYLGTFAMSVIVGLLTGVSASPVVGVVIPLLFSAVTAGGAVYTFTANENVSKSRKIFLGKNTLIFSLGFLLGLWFGVAAKFNPSSIWPGTEKPVFVYSEIPHLDATTLNASIELERKMIAVGTSAAKRKEILSKMVESINKRRTTDGRLDSDDLRALEKVVLPKTSDPGTPMIPVANNPVKQDPLDWFKG